MDYIDICRGLLGEHTKHYVVLYISPDCPDTIQIRTDDKYAGSGITRKALSIFDANIIDEGWEIVWDEEDTNSEDNEDNLGSD